MLFSTPIKTFGLDISDQSLKIAQITKSGYDLQLTSCHKINLPVGILNNGEIKNEIELIKHIKRLINECQSKITSNYVVACLPETKTFIKLINIVAPDKNHHSQEKLNQLIREDLPHHIPLPIEDIYFDWQIIRQEGNNFKILIGVAPKETVNSFSQLLKKSDLVPMALEIEAEAIIRAIFPQSNHSLKKVPLPKKINFDQVFKKIKTADKQKNNLSFKTRFMSSRLNSRLDSINLKQMVKKQTNNNEMSWEQKNNYHTVYFVIDCGASRSGLIIWADKTIQLTTSLKTCGNHLTQTISQKLGLETNKAEKLKIIYGLETKKGKIQIKKVLKPIIEELCQEIIKAKEFYQNHFPNHRRHYEIILTGGSANLAGLDSELSRQLDMKVNRANPLINLAPKQKIKLNQKEAQSYATAIGLALRSHFVKDY